MDDYNKIFSNKQTILVVTAHPDDLDVMCGGTVARLCADGKKVISVKATDGNRGSGDKTISPEMLAKTRANEDAKAMATLGVHESISLHIDDGAVAANDALIEQIAFQIRKHQPDIVITLNPEAIFMQDSAGKTWVNHRDHRNVAQATVDAVYPFSRDRSFFSEQFAQGVKPGACNELLILESWASSNSTINIADVAQTKLKAIRAHESQFSKESAQKAFDMYTTNNAESFRHIILPS